MFVAEKAKEKQKEVVVVTTKAVKCSCGLFLDKDHNTDPMVVVNVDQKEQSVVFKNVKFLCEWCQQLAFDVGAVCQMNCKVCHEKQIAKIFEDNVPGQQSNGVTNDPRLTTDPRLNQNRIRDQESKIDPQMNGDRATRFSIAKSPNCQSIANTPYSSPTHNIHQLMSDI